MIVDWIFFNLLSVLDMSKIRNNIGFYALLVLASDFNFFSLIYCLWLFLPR